MIDHDLSNLRGLGMVWLLLTTVNTVALASDGIQSEPIDPGDRATLVELVESFFRCEETERRSTLIGKIDAAADGSIEAVVEAVHSVRLWQMPESSTGTFSFSSASGDTTEVVYNLPLGYDTALRHPSVVCIPNRGSSPGDTIVEAARLLGKSMETFAIICPSRPLGGSFHRDVPAGDDFRRFLREARRLYHIDTDRTYLFGVGTGGDAAWMVAIAHPHEFAGAIFVSSYLCVPYPQQLYPLLLGNLRSLPAFTVWHAADESTGSVRETAVAAHNRAIIAVAGQQGLAITGRKAAPASPTETAAFSKQIEAILAQPRVVSPPRVSHWLRYPDQGDVSWLRLGKFRGDVWQEEQLAILVSPTTDRDEYITGIIEDKLAYIGATVQGQTIDIETRKCSKLDILLPLGLVDFDRPVTIRCNGKRRHDGPIRPSIRTLLETTYETWDFQRLTPARLTLTIKSDRQEAVP